MKNNLLLLSFLFLFAKTITAQDSTRTGLLYGFNNAYYLTAPSGWIMDSESGKEQGLSAVFFPTGSSWATGETVMYSMFSGYDSARSETLKDFIKSDSIRYKENSPNSSVSIQEPIKIGKEKTAIVYSYSDFEHKNYDLIAYIGEGKGVVMIVITSLDNNGCINHYSSYQSLVRSYRFLTDKVNIQLGK